MHWIECGNSFGCVRECRELSCYRPFPQSGVAEMVANYAATGSRTTGGNQVRYTCWWYSTAVSNILLKTLKRAQTGRRRGPVLQDTFTMYAPG